MSLSGLSISMLDGIRYLFLFFGSMLHHPVLLGECALLVAAISGAGRAIGLPSLFWHERPLYRFIAGTASTLVIAELIMVAFLLGGASLDPSVGGLDRHLLAGGGLWMVVLGWCVFRRPTDSRDGRSSSEVSGVLAPREGSGPVSTRGRVPLAPSIARDGVLQRREAPQASISSFFYGVACAVLVVLALRALGRNLAPSPPVVSSLRHFTRFGPTDARLHQMAAGIFGTVLLTFLVLKAFRSRLKATPALGICITLALTASAYGAIAFYFQSLGIGLAAGILFAIATFFFGGLPKYKLRIHHFASHYKCPVDYPPRVATPPDAAAVTTFVDALSSGGTPRWPGDTLSPEAGGEHFSSNVDRPVKRPMIVLATSGGGIRAAAWTGALLERFDEIAGFRAALRMISGASGGMVGASFWIASIPGIGGADATSPAAGGKVLDRARPGALIDAVTEDFLTPLARCLFFHDFVHAGLPTHNRTDRGAALEDAWCDAAAARGWNLRLPLSVLLQGELRGDIPSLVFSPMLLEDGQRLILANARLRSVTTNEVTWLSSAQRSTPHVDVASRSAVHVSDLFPGTWRDLPLSTIARLSAAFPYISPAVSLPTRPIRRVVDAGYFDNYGGHIACGWLRESLERNRAWMVENVSKVLLIQIRDSSSPRGQDPRRDAHSESAPGGTHDGRTPTGLPAHEQQDPGALGRGLGWLTGPIRGLLAARQAVTLFRNDAELEAIHSLYTAHFGPGFLTTTIFELRAEVSLSWYLTTLEKDLIRSQCDSPGIHQKIAAIKDWIQPSG